ncbi:MAG TPA: c-type cytochrome domain-containing protein, partial [Gemmataceae bacterium]|nr:c-type cytochrome domain-containing protein [Gemmataceae bacterium]
MTSRLRTAAAVAGLLLFAPPVRAADTKPTPAQVAFFDKEVKPILQQSCVKCHGGEKVRGGLSLTSRDAVLKGGDNGPAAVSERPDASQLVKAINWRDGLEMPPKGKLPPEQVATLTKWVKVGLPWAPGVELGKEATAAEPKGGVVTEESKNYWCYRPVKRPEIPAVKDREWVHNPIDAFLLAKLEAKRLTPAPPADRVALVRRAYYDLTGLPPTP